MNIRRLSILLTLSFVASIQLGLIIPFFSMIAYQQNISTSLSGLVAAMTPLGGLVITLFSEKIVKKWGFKHTIGFGLLGNLLLFTCLWIQPYSFVNWMITRFLMGMMFSLTFMPAQTSIGIEVRSNRAVYVNLIGVVFVIGLTIGPVLTNLMVYGPRLVLGIILGLQCISFVVLFGLVNTYPPQSEIHQRLVTRLKVFRKIGIAFIPALLFGCCEISLMALFPQEALAKDFSVSQISLIIALFSFSAVISQIPISMLADKYSPRRIATFLYPLIASLLFIPFWSFTFVSIGAVTIGLGMLIGHGYYFSVAYVNSLVTQEELVKSNILIEMSYNCFAIIVPLFAGYYLQIFQQSSIFVPLFVVSLLACVIHYIAIFHSRRNYA